MGWGLLAFGTLLFGVATAAYVTRRRWLRWLRLRRFPFRARHPIVLVHGLFGFDEVKLGKERHEYFRGIEARLRQHGNEVYRPRLPATAGIRARAEALRNYLEALGPRPVILIAHSMGGLDARYALARLALGPRVRALITIGTPHRGTPVADIGGKLQKVLRPVAKALRLNVDAFSDLTSGQMEDFNREIEDVAGVLYGSVVGRAGPNVHPMLKLTRQFLDKEGDNDGLVPASSQAWGEVLFEAEVDHWGQVGWREGYDAGALYEAVVMELRARGY
ncbi:MAG: alpha/beta fold hydrolase [Myxococcota bacterium]